MKLTAVLGIAVFAISIRPVFAGPRPADPCQHSESNADEGRCYAREQARVNGEADSLATRYATEFRNGAVAEEKLDKGSVSAGLLRKGADAIVRSQEKWKAYRDEQCQAVQYSFTTGSGAGTAYETCMFELGQQRVKELKSNFADIDFRSQ